MYDWQNESIDPYFLHSGHWPMQELREEFDRNRLVILRDFASEMATSRMLLEIEPILPLVHYADIMTEPDGRGDQEADSPFRMGYVAQDQMGPHLLVRRLFMSPVFWKGLGELAGHRIYPYADPLMGATVGIMPPGGEIGWHTDGSDLTASVVIQDAEEGAVFEYRNPEGEVRQANLRKGDLQIFSGGVVSHRVLPIRGDRVRITAIFDFCFQPGYIAWPPENLERMFGRAHPIHHQVKEHGSIKIRPYTEGGY